MTQINKNLKLQRDILLILVLFAYFIGNFVGKNSINQNMANSNEQTSTSNNSNNIESSSSTNKSNQTSPDTQNNNDLPTPNKSETNEPEYIEIEVGTTIYKDEQLSEILIESTETKVKAQIIDTGDDWLKIMRTVYSHKSTSTDQNCANPEITLNENIRIDSYTNAQKFGKLKQPSKFRNKKVDNNGELEWCEFLFEGYIKK